MPVSPVHHGRNRYFTPPAFRHYIKRGKGFQGIANYIRTHGNSRYLRVYHLSLDTNWATIYINGNYSKIGKRCRARVHKQGFPAVSEMFDTKARAQEWASKVESDMRSLKFQDGRIIAEMTIGALTAHCIREIGTENPLVKISLRNCARSKQRLVMSSCPI